MIRPKGKALQIAKDSVPGLARWALKASRPDAKVRPDLSELQNQSMRGTRGYKKGREK